MDRQEYVEYTKARIIENFLKEMNAMSSEEILECGRSCLLCLKPFTEKSDQDSAIVEGITSSEVDNMLGVNDAHDCKLSPFLDDSTLSMDINVNQDDYQCDENDSDEEDPFTQNEETIDDHIMESLREALDMLSAAPNAHLILAYMYTSSNDSNSSSSDIKGQSVIFGSRKFVDYLMNDIREQINSNTKDGHVSTGDTADDPE